MARKIGICFFVLFTTCSGVNLCVAESFFNSKDFRSFVSDNRAHQIGDTVTVIISERSRAASQAGTDSNSNISANAEANDSVNSVNVGLGFGRDSADGAQTSREGRFTGQIAARVVAVDAQGLLQLNGHQKLIINGESQTISLTGYVRPIDIRADNTVASNRLSEAEIVLTGEGVVDQGQDPNIITKILSWLGL